MSYIIKTSHDYKYYVQKEYFKTTSPELIRYLISNYYKISSLTLLCISNRCYMSNKVEHSARMTHVDVCKIRYFIIIINIKHRLHSGGHTLSIIKSRKYSSSSFSFSVLNLLIILFFSTPPVEVTY